MELVPKIKSMLVETETSIKLIFHNMKGEIVRELKFIMPESGKKEK